MNVDFNTLVMIDRGVPVTTSLRIAEIFKKRHTEVLRAIKKLGCSDGFRQRNFASAEYLDNQKKPRPMFEITRDGFAFLAMGFTGKEADQFKEKYIDAFNWMQEELIKRGLSLFQRYNFVSLKYQGKKDQVSNSARNMRSWRDEKPQLLCELTSLEGELQPHLPHLEIQ